MDITDDKSEKSESEEHHDNDIARSTMYKRRIFGRQKTCK